MSLFEIYYKDKNEFKNLDLTLNRINSALKESNIDINNLGKIVHIAGTNGKGSTSTFLAQILIDNGLNVGLFTSPHILNIKERISYNLNDIDIDTFNKIFQNYSKLIKKYKLSFFEGIFFISVIWFNKIKPDITILETGLGGRYDATNTSIIEEKIIGITSISQDHKDILGKNIYKITDEKLGIIRDKNIIFLGVNKDFILKYIEEKLPNTIIKTEVSKFDIKNYPSPYSENYALAKSIAKYILKKDIIDKKSYYLPPCRLEEINNIILDGSHNPAGLIQLSKILKDKDIKCIIFSCTKDRNIEISINILKSITTNIILTTIPENIRSIDKNSVKNINITFYENIHEAFKNTRKLYNKGKILITGSFYLAGYMKKVIKSNIIC